jgi:[acyl-carrier-protein] S-malonyltransferase
MNIAFTFPGQGSQSVGMLADLAQSHPQIEETFAEASRVLGFDLWEVAQTGPEERLNATQCTQPAMLAGGVAVARMLRDLRPALAPTFLAGHSLGEYSALVVAGGLEFEAAVRLVAERARCMQEAVASGEGAVAAILGLEDEQVIEVCTEAGGGEVVQAVNFNAPGQVVIAGHASAVERAVDVAKKRGAKRALRLPLSVPVHCDLMRPAALRFSEILRSASLATPRIPVLHNADVTSGKDPEQIRVALVQQIHRPVHWTRTVRTLISSGIDTLVEVGPGKVLTGLAKRIDRNVGAVPTCDPDTLDRFLERLGAR